jgi:hypothetical protein
MNDSDNKDVVKEFRDSKIFQVALTKNEFNQDSEITITTIKDQPLIDPEKKEYAKEILFKFLLNFEKAFDSLSQEIGFDLLLPALATEIVARYEYKIFLTNFEESIKGDDSMEDIYTNDCPDTVSKMALILSFQIGVLTDEFKDNTRSIEDIMAENTEFISFMLSVIESLPMVYYNVAFHYYDQKLLEKQKKEKKQIKKK